VTGRSPARLLAPAALVAAVVALFVVVSSPSGDSGDDSNATPSPVATATASAKPERKRDEGSGETYTVEPGDTPLGIAEKEGVDVDELLAINPDIDPNGLVVGQELELP
jgi:LysM repeat protein